MKKLLILIILGIFIIGCVEKPKITEPKITEQPQITEPKIAEQPINVTEDKEIYEKGDWYIYTYDGPPNIENSENARMAIIPHLRELGWNGGINVVYGSSVSTNHSIIIVLPFLLNQTSTNYLNQTLSNYSFMPVTLNQKVENK